jgi:beta-glucosidase
MRSSVTFAVLLALTGCGIQCVPAAANSSTVSANDLARAKALVARMTLPEKIEEVHGEGTHLHPRHIVGIPRLGIPELRLANGCVGVGPADDWPQKPATALPCELSLAATWNPALAMRYGEVIGREARDLNYGMVEGPDINIARVPQNGRTFEGYGEDPFLTSQTAVAVIRGIQSRHVMAEAKHFDANNQETDRGGINEIIALRTLHEIYFPAFKAAVRQAAVAAVMGAYNRVNGVFCCQNKYLLTDTLRDRWHFAGFVTSDFGATHSTIASALHGLDVEMPKGKYFAKGLQSAVQSGRVPVKVLNNMLVQRFATMMRFHLFSHPPALRPIPIRRDGELALHAAEQGMVLLKNHGGLLPLDAAKIHSIAVIGPYAVRAMTGGGGSSHVIPLFTIKPVRGIKNLAGAHVHVLFNNGANIAQAVRLARAAQIAIVMVGDHETEGHDHPLTLSKHQNHLVEAVAAANEHTVVVLKTGSAMILPWVQQVPAILEAWYPGEEDGNAVAAVLFGEVNPSGKLPMTFPANAMQLPAHTQQQYPGVPVKGSRNLVAHYSEGIFVGYRYYDQHHLKPTFPFGYGLSYTTFRFSDLHILTPRLRDTPGKTLRMTLTVTNTGRRAGAEVAQLYLGYPSSKTAPEPPEQLRAFARVALQPGQSKQVKLSVPVSALSYWSATRRSWQTLPGTYRIMVGDSSADVPLHGEVTLQK